MNGLLRHVWVTRPQPGATKTAERLAAMGFAPWVAPLTEIVGLEADLAPLSACHALVFTSANAARFLPHDTMIRHHDRPVFAVGEATADAIHRAGFHTVIIGPGDAQSLAPLIAAHTGAGDTIGYIAGRQRTGLLEQALAKLDRRTVLVETYDTKKVSQITYKETSFFETAEPRAILVYSALSAQVLVSWWKAQELRQIFDNSHIIAISQRVADALAPIKAAACVVADTPDEAGMMAALQALAANKS